MGEEGRYDVRAGGSWKQVSPFALARYFFGLRGKSGFGSATTAEEVAREWDGKGKTAIVTGPYTGIGLATARELACRGCEVILAGRGANSEERGDKWITKHILSRCPSARVTALELDLSSLASVKTFATAFKKTGKDLNILVNNAGIMKIPQFTKSADGHELQFATNHLGHFLLTRLLLEDLKRSAKKKGAPQSRVVNVASTAQYMSYKKGILQEGEIDDPEHYDDWRAYGQSKVSFSTLSLSLKQSKDADAVCVCCVLCVFS